MKETYVRNRIIAGGVIIVILIGFLVFALVHSSSPSPAVKTKHPMPAQAQNKSSKPQASGQSDASQNNSAGSSALSNTGPGDTVALFALTSMVGYGAYMFRLSKRIAE